VTNAEQSREAGKNEGNGTMFTSGIVSRERRAPSPPQSEHRRIGILDYVPVVRGEDGLDGTS
jgi:hypothetical protein